MICNLGDPMSLRHPVHCFAERSEGHHCAGPKFWTAQFLREFHNTLSVLRECYTTTPQREGRHCAGPVCWKANHQGQYAEKQIKGVVQYIECTQGNIAIFVECNFRISLSRAYRGSGTRKDLQMIRPVCCVPVQGKGIIEQGLSSLWDLRATKSRNRSKMTSQVSGPKDQKGFANHSPYLFGV